MVCSLTCRDTTTTICSLLLLENYRTTWLPFHCTVTEARQYSASTQCMPTRTTSVDAKHHGVSLCKWYDVTWVGDSACVSEQCRAASSTSYSTISYLLQSVSSHVCLHKYSKHSHSSYFSQASLFAVFAHAARAGKQSAEQKYYLLSAHSVWLC